MSHYQQYIDHFSQISKLASLNKELEYETYGLIVDFAEEDFMFVWNIDRMTKHIKETKMSPFKILTSYIYRVGVYEDELYPNPVPKNPHNPIICVEDMFADNRLLCVNGNHRVQKAHNAGIKEIETYVFRGTSHCQFMDTKFQELFWKFLADIRTINAFVLDPKPLIKAEEVTKELHLYNIENYQV